MRAESPILASPSRRRGRGRSTPFTLRSASRVSSLVAVLVGLAFAGSSAELAEGTRVAGIDVGGLTQADAVAKLTQQYRDVSAEPATFVAAGS